MNHSYEGHAKKCFGMKQNRNKESLKEFERKTCNYIESPETERIKGSYRYETAAYHYKKPDENLIVTVNATNNKYISVINAIGLSSLSQAPIMKLDTRVGSVKFAPSKVIPKNKITFIEVSQIDKTCVEHYSLAH